jgi:hypothetical protein
MTHKDAIFIRFRQMLIFPLSSHYAVKAKREKEESERGLSLETGVCT